MYKLKLAVYPDGDFGYRTSLYDDYGEVHEFYYESREEAVTDLLTFYDELADTVNSSKKYMQNVVDKIKGFKPIIHKLVRKVETFELDFYFGNPEMFITLSEVEEIRDGNKLYYNEKYVAYTFDGAQNPEYYNWDGLDNLIDV